MIRDYLNDDCGQFDEIVVPEQGWPFCRIWKRTRGGRRRGIRWLLRRSCKRLWWRLLSFRIHLRAHTSCWWDGRAVFSIPKSSWHVRTRDSYGTWDIDERTSWARQFSRRFRCYAGSNGCSGCERGANRVREAEVVAVRDHVRTELSQVGHSFTVFREWFSLVMLEALNIFD